MILADPAARAAVASTDLSGFYEVSATANYYQALAEFVAEHLPGGGLVLDLGCSVGRLAHELARHARFVVGIDPAGLQIQVARQIAAERRIRFRPGEATVSGTFAGGPEVVVDVNSIVQPNVEFMVADDSTLPFRSLDAIVCSAVIDCVPEAPPFRERLLRVARDGTIVVISSPFDQDERFVPRQHWLGSGAFDAGIGRAEDALRKVARRLGLRLLGARELPWWTFKDRRNHFVWGVNCGVFEVWRTKIRRRFPDAPTSRTPCSGGAALLRRGSLKQGSW